MTHQEKRIEETLAFNDFLVSSDFDSEQKTVAFGIAIATLSTSDAELEEHLASVEEAAMLQWDQTGNGSFGRSLSAEEAATYEEVIEDLADFRRSMGKHASEAVIQALRDSESYLKVIAELKK